LNGLQIVNDYDEDAALLAKAAKALSLAETVPADFSNTEKLMFNALVQSLSPTQEMQNQGRVSITYPAFQAMARHIAGVLGRKSLMWITSAFPVTYGNSTERRQDDQKELDRFIRVLSENNIVTYTIDPSGTGSTEMSGQEGLGATRGGSFVQRGAAPSANEGVILATELGTPRNAAGTGSMNQTDTSLTGTQALQTITDKTGGKSYRNGNDISIALREVLSASEYIYTLGFYPDAASLNGSDRDLKVTLTKTDIKAKITNRKHYYAWGPNLSKDLRDVPEMQKLLDQRVPATRVGLLASARPEAPESGKTVVDVVVSGGDLRFDPVGDRWKGDFEMVIIAAGTNVQSSMTYPLDFSQQEMKIAVERGIPIRQVLQTGSQEGAFYIALIDNKSGNAGSTVLPFKAAATAPAAPVIMPATAPVVTPGAPPQR
jgi:VWFA-related protein